MYVVDSGILVDHTEFQRRASCGFSYWNDTCEDLFGLGTHRAGIVVSP